MAERKTFSEHFQCREKKFSCCVFFPAVVFPMGYSCGVLQVEQTQALAHTSTVLSILSSFVLNPIIFGSLLHLTGQEDQ